MWPNDSAETVSHETIYNAICTHAANSSES
jgi:hypothetical protein